MPVTLQVAWTFSTGVLRGHEGQPLVIGNVMYLVTPFPNTVYALDLNHEERILWQYQPTQNAEVIPVMCCDTVNRGVAYGDGKIILHQADNTVVALNAQTGKEVWKTPLASYKEGATGTDAPLVVGNKVIVGVSGGEFGVQGFIAALDINDGHTLWKAFSEGPDEPDSVRFAYDIAGQAGGYELQSEHLEGRRMEDRWRRYLGLVFV